MIATWTKEREGSWEGAIYFGRPGDADSIKLRVFMNVFHEIDEARVWVFIRPDTVKDKKLLHRPDAQKPTHPTIPAEFYVSYPMGLPVDQCKVCEGSGTAPPFAGEDAKKCPACEGETVDMCGLAMRVVEDFVRGAEARWIKEARDANGET